MIKEICAEQIPQCVNVIRESFGTVAREFGITEENAPRFTAFSTTSERLIWQLDSEHRPMYAYFVGSEIIGYYSLSVSGKECELNNLCVLPSYRHDGIGAELLRHAFDTAAELGCDTMNIGIVEENKVLRKWYEKHGFVHTHTQKFDFFPFTCGYMSKKISPK